MSEKAAGSATFLSSNTSELLKQKPSHKLNEQSNRTTPWRNDRESLLSSYCDPGWLTALEVEGGRRVWQANEGGELRAA